MEQQGEAVVVVRVQPEVWAGQLQAGQSPVQQWLHGSLAPVQGDVGSQAALTVL